MGENGRKWLGKQSERSQLVKKSSELSQNVPLDPKMSQNVQLRRIVVQMDLFSKIFPFVHSPYLISFSLFFCLVCLSLSVHALFLSLPALIKFEYVCLSRPSSIKSDVKRLSNPAVILRIFLLFPLLYPALKAAIFIRSKRLTLLNYIWQVQQQTSTVLLTPRKRDRLTKAILFSDMSVD